MTDLSRFKVAKAFRHIPAQHGLVDDISSGFTSIRYRGKVWALQYAGETYPFKRDDDGSPLTYLDMIILGIGAGTSKLYFGTDDWNEDSAGAPICASLHGDVPDPGVPVPQSKTCGLCKNNEWGSKPGSRGKACQDHKKLAVLLMPAMTKKMLNGAPLLEPVFFKIPPGSFRPMKVYFDELTHAGLPYQSVVTRVAFSNEKQFQFTFETQQSLTDAEAPLVLPLMESAQTRQLIGGRSMVREIMPPPASEKIETGLLEAFGAAPAGNGNAATPVARRGPGRPRKEETVEAKTVEAKPVETKPAPAVEQTPEIENWEESDTDLDATVAKLMGGKMKNMLK